MARSLLGRRLLSATRLARYERRIEAAIASALARQQALARAALTAAVVPDPFGLDVWDATVDSEVAPVIAQILREAAAGTLQFLTLPEATKSLVLGRIDVDHEAASFTARIQGLGDLVAERLRDTLNQGSALGESIPDLQDRVLAEFAVGERRGETIARTEMNGAANRMGNETAGALNSEVALTKTWLAALDDRVRDAHADADGQTVPYDQPFEVDGEELDYPGDPAGSAENVINCRAVACGTLVAAPGLVAVSRVAVSEPVVRIVTAGGAHLTASPDHPILTPAGFVRAGALRPGDYVVRCARAEGAAGPVQDVDHREPSIEEAFEALSLSGLGAQRVRARAVQLGSEPVAEAEIDVARADHPLPFGLEASGGQEADEIHLALAHGEMSFYPHAPACVVFPEAQLVRSARGSAANAGPPEARRDERTGHAEGLGDSQFALTGSVAVRHQVDGDAAALDSGSRAAGCLVAERAEEASPLELRDPCVVGDVRFIAGLLGVPAGDVQLDRVLDTVSEWCQGHLYDLQTTTGWFVADGIVVHNCAVIYDEAVPEEDQAA